MNAEKFLANFGHIANAPEGVKRLRELTLHLAITGRLSRAIKGDSDADCIIESARIGKERYFEERKARLAKSKTVELTQLTRRLPDHWKLVPAGDLVHLVNGRAFSSRDWRPSGLPIIRIQNLNNPRARFNYFQGEVSENHRVANGDMLLSWSGTPGTSFGAFIWTGKEAVLNQHIFKVSIYSNLIDKAFLKLAINASLDALIGGARGGVGLKHVTKGQIDALLLPVPPAEEQKRIAAKVDELMALCDRLEAQQQERERKFPIFSRTAHALFADDPTSGNLNRIFDEIGAVSPENLRTSIRALAIRGKLVPQNPIEDPASILLTQISKHKVELARESKLRGPTSVNALNRDEGPYAIPLTWEWVRFGSIMVNRDGERVPVSKEERGARAKNYDYYGASGVIDKIDNYLFDKPLLLIGEDGANLINRSTPIAFIARGQYWVNNHAHVLDGISEDFLRYIELHINAINLEAYVTGTAQPKMNQAKMNNIPIALPPLAEQRRILARVDELMALIDHLETQQQQRDQLAEAFAKACVASFTGTTTLEKTEKMKAPKTELVSLVSLDKKPKADANAPLASLLIKQDGELSAKALWQQSGLEIDAFYHQLKSEIAQGWIVPQPAEVKVLEGA